MNENIYNKIQRIFVNNYDSYEELNRKEKKIYNYIWNEITNAYIFASNEDSYSCIYVDNFTFSSELNLFLIKDGFNIKIVKNNNKYIYTLSIKNETINNIINNEQTKTLQR